MCMVILIAIISVAVIADIRYYKIPNICIILGMAAGMIESIRYGGAEELVQRLIQIMLLFILLYPFYLLGGIGAGDIKLWLVTGWYMKAEVWLYSILISLLIASVVALYKIIRYQENRKRFQYFFSFIRKAVMLGVIEKYPQHKIDKKSIIRLSIPIWCSVLLYYGGLYG